MNRSPRATSEKTPNRLAHELYFPEEMHAAGLRLFDLVASANLPDVTALPEADRLPRLRQKFDELHDGAQPPASPWIDFKPETPST